VANTIGTTRSNLIATFTAALLVVTSTSSVAFQAPIPRALLTAKRAYLLNEAGDLKRFDSLADELRKWGRFELVDQKDNADVLIVFGKIVKGQAGSARNSGYVAPVERVTLEIRDRTDESLLWREETGPLFSPEQRLTKHLRERLASAEQLKK